MPRRFLSYMTHDVLTDIFHPLIYRVAIFPLTSLSFCLLTHPFIIHLFIHPLFIYLLKHLSPISTLLFNVTNLLLCILIFFLPNPDNWV